jgi:hypothetical protein
MKHCWKLELALFGAVLGLSLRADTVLACAACYGKSDSSLAQGMNWGIAALLAVVLTVLSGIVAFFVHVAKRTASVGARPEMSRPAEPAPEI